MVNWNMTIGELVKKLNEDAQAEAIEAQGLKVSTKGANKKDMAVDVDVGAIQKGELNG